MLCDDSTATPGRAQTFDNMADAENYARKLREFAAEERIIAIRTVTDAFKL